MYHVVPTTVSFRGRLYHLAAEQLPHEEEEKLELEYLDKLRGSWDQLVKKFPKKQLSPEVVELSNSVSESIEALIKLHEEYRTAQTGRQQKLLKSALEHVEVAQERLSNFLDEIEAGTEEYRNVSKLGRILDSVRKYLSEKVHGEISKRLEEKAKQLA